MGNPVKKKKRDSSSSSSDSSSESDASSVKEKKTKKRSSSSEESDDGKKQKVHKLDKNTKEETNEKIKKHKYDDVQKSKWDSPAENVSRNDRRLDKDSRRRRDDNRDFRKHVDRSRNDRRDDHRKDDRRHRENSREEERRHKDDVRDEDRRYKERYNKERGGRYERRPNEDRYKPDRRRNSRERSHSRDREDRKREDFRRNKRPRFNNSEEHENYEWGKKKNEDEKKNPADKEKPNFGLSGKLTEDTNTYRGIVIKYSEPPEARKPKRRWRLYPFKGEKALPTLYIHRESAYLMGRERKVVDFPLDHPSCSKQHAVLQYRLVPFTRDNGTTGKRVRPYLIDLDSANGTYINNKRIEARKYYELLEKDVIKFGYSTREYVLLHENSKDETQDDDVKAEDEEVQIKEEPAE